MSRVTAGTMQHVAFNVDAFEDLMALRDRIRDRGVQVFGPIDHGFVQSIYFAGPEGLALEGGVRVGHSRGAVGRPRGAGSVRHLRGRARNG